MVDMSWWERIDSTSRDSLRTHQRKVIAWSIHSDLANNGAPVIQPISGKSIYVLSDEVWQQIDTLSGPDEWHDPSPLNWSNEIPDEFSISVAKAVGAFRSGLIDLIPTAQRLGLTWQDLNTHDDWEMLAESVFSACVTHPLEAGQSDSFRLARYDFDLDSYADLSWLEVESDGAPPLVLVRFLSAAEPFDTAHLVQVDPQSGATGAHIRVPAASLTFRLRRRFDSGDFELVHELLLAD